MLRSLVTHLRHNVIAYLALFIALSGTAVAATIKLKANTVGTSQIKNGAVTSAKIANGAVTNGKLAKSIQSTLKQPTNESLMMGGSGGSGNDGLNGSQLYLAPQGLSVPGGELSSVQLGTSAVASTATDLDIQLTSSPSAPYTFALIVNGAPSDLSCQIAKDAEPAACTDTTDKVLLPAGSEVALEVIPGEGAEFGDLNAQITFGWLDTTSS